MSKIDKKLDRVLQTIAENGLVSGYELKKMLGVPLSTAQRWLQSLKSNGEVAVYNPKTIPIEKKPYGLTLKGFLTVLSIPKVRHNFSKAFEKFVNSLPEDIPVNSEIKENLLGAIKDPSILDRFKEYHLAIANALAELQDPDSLDDDTLIQLATQLATIRNTEKMLSILKDLYPRVLFIRYIVDAYRQHAIMLDKMVKGETD